MNTVVYSTLGPQDPASQPLSPSLKHALDCAGREDWTSAYHALQVAAASPEDRLCAHYMLWEVCQILGHPDVALANLHAALQESPVTSRFSPAPRRRILALAVPGDFQANLPINSLLTAAGTEIHTLWLSDPEAVLRDPAGVFAGRLPPFDCAFVSIAEDDRHVQALRAADSLVQALNVPVINSGAGISAVSRAGAARLLRDLPDAIVPSHTLMDRAELVRRDTRGLTSKILEFPVIIRPSRSHAGRDLVRLDSQADLDTYLDRVGENLFYVAPFIDYRSADGLWRKYRVIFVGGRPMPYHLAIHSDWAIWYYNARMDLDPWKRLEEARFVRGIEAAIPSRALNALHAVGERVGLDYFGADCGVTQDGRLVIFEIETGMLVHDWDSSELYPYRAACTQAIRQATETMIDAAVASHRLLTMPSAPHEIETAS